MENTNSLDKTIFKKKKLIEVVKNLSNIEYLEIFDIIKKDKCQFSENKNGIFINLNNISEETVDKIFNFIKFIKHKKEDLLKQEDIINIAKKSININKIHESEKNTQTYNEESIFNDILSDDEEKDNDTSNYLHFSSDEDEDVENKISLKKKKIKHSAKKAKMIKSIKSKTKKSEE